MFRGLLLLPALALAGAAEAQNAPTAVDYANLREDVRGLDQRLNDLSLRVDALERQAGQLSAAAQAGDRGYATLVQLNAAVADLNRSIQAEVASSQADTLRRVGEQMEKLARQVNAALGSLGPKAAAAPVAADFPKTGISYTVQKGDTLGLISRKTGGKVQDIVAANKIADPSRIRVGQVLFIPGGK